MPIAAGTRLGPYDVLAPIGAGGMGEVYRARDRKLDRDVAIKVLPESLSADPDRIARFEREAKALAALNHPNIAQIYGLERQEGREGQDVDFIVMELVGGSTLADLVAKGPLPVDEAVKVAVQIADALDAAHEKGIVHRDLKPANVKVDEGRVKVLDFGLAKALDPSGGAGGSSGSVGPGGLTLSPTLSVHGTFAGTILGTAAYMSPEQAKGKAVDKRTDIWAFGCVLFEMLTGARAFAGDDVTDFIVAVMTKEPDWGRLPPATPARVVDLMKRCLKKDPRERLRDIGDARIELARDRGVEPESPGATAASPRRVPAALIVVTVAVTAAVVSGIWWAVARPSSASATPIHLSVQLAPDAKVNGFDGTTNATVSPDGRWIAYVAQHDGKPGLFVHDLRESAPRFVSGTENAVHPTFSPDSHSIAFSAGKALRRVSLTGGSPVSICAVSSGEQITAMAWGADDRILFVPAFNAGIWSVPAAGGTPRLLLKTDEAKDRIAYTQLQVLPDNKGILFTLSSSRAITTEDEQIAILPTGAEEPQVLPIRGVTQGRYVRSGHIVYTYRGEMLAVPFNLATLRVTGSPVTVLTGLGTSPLWDSDFSVSDTGTLMYAGQSASSSGNVLAIVDRKGAVRRISDNHALPTDFSISPDGKQIAAELLAVNNDIWVYDVADGTPVRLTFEPGDEVYPQWTPDGRRIAFGTRVGRMFWKSADGTGQREEFPRGEYPRAPSSFSPDGKVLAFVEQHPSTRSDIWLMSLDGDRKAQPLLNTDADEKAPKFSPDGRSLVYVSDETGRDEVWIRPIGAAGARKRLSTGGGDWPTWNRNGREVFFLRADTLMAVDVDAAMNRVGAERVVMSAPKDADHAFQSGDYPYYDVMPDGQHFVFTLTPKYQPPTHFNVVVNWTEELKQRVPTR